MGFLSLIIRLGADTTGFSKGVKQMGVEADGAGTKIAGAIRRYVSAAAALAAIKKTVAFAGEIKDTADRLEIGTNAVQQFGEAARRGGEDIGAAATGMEKLGKAIDEGMADPKKLGELQKNLSAFGLTLEDVKSKSSEDVFRAMLASMAEGGTETGKLSAGFDLIGKSYGKLIPMAKEMDSVKGMKVLSPEEVHELDEADDALNSFWTSLKVLTGKGLAGIPKIPGIVVEGLNPFMSFNEGSVVREEAARQRRAQDIEDAKILAAGIATVKKEEALRYAEATKVASVHIAAMDRITALEKEAESIGEQARKKALTEEQRRNELLERRAKLMEHLNSQPAEVGVGMDEKNAALKKELAQINLDLASEPKQRGGGGFTQAEGAARQGLFLGGRNDPLVDINRQQLQVLKLIEKHASKLTNARDVNSYFSE